MDKTSFETALRTEGYVQVESKRLEPKPANSEHGHPWETRGFIVDGVFTITRGGVARAYRAGDIFEVAANEPHFEEVGAGGVELIVGRKY